LWRLVEINLTNRFYATVLPRGASTAIRWHRYRSGGDGHGALALMLFEGLVMTHTLFLCAVSLLVLDYDRAGTSVKWILVVAVLGVAACTLALLPFFSHKLAGSLRSIKEAIPFLGARLKGTLGRSIDAVAAYKGLPSTIVLAIYGSDVATFMFQVLSAWVLCIALDIDLALGTVAWIRALTLVLMLLPFTIGGLGLREGAHIFLMGLYGVSAGDAMTFSLMMFAIQLGIGLLGGGMELLRVVNGYLRP
jgi:hypothetical protein